LFVNFKSHHPHSSQKPVNCVVFVPDDAAVGAIGVPVSVGEAKFAFKFNAICVAVEIALLHRLYCSTFAKPLPVLW
jgi:hypothetical protein